MTTEEILHLIHEAAFEVRRNLTPGYEEIIYKKALARELYNRGIECTREYPIAVYYKGEIMGNYLADLIVNKQIIIEVKATKDHSPAHERQLINYLASTGLEDGVLINYGTDVFIYRHKVRDYSRIKKLN